MPEINIMNEADKNSYLADKSSIGAGISAVLKMLHYLFVLLSFGIVGLLIWYFSFGGAFTVEEQERVLVMNFGKLSDKVYEPGWHWNWPYPISEIVRIPVNQQTIITDAFWFYIDPARVQSKDLDTLSDGPPPPLIPGRGGYLFTGDTNIIHVGWGMFYRVSDPIKYYEKCMGPADPRDGDPVIIHPATGEKVGTRGPQTVLQALFENTIIKTTAKVTVDYALKSPQYRKDVAEAVKKAILKEDIGITVDEVWLDGRTPPLGAQRAFRAVFDAQNDSFSAQNKAKSYAIKMKNQAESESVGLIADAEAYRTRVVASIKADATYFKAMLKEYRKNPDIVLVSRYSEVLGDVLRLVDDKFVIRTNENGKQEIRILLNREPKKKEEKKKKEENN